MASISTSILGSTSALTSTSVLAGRASPKNSWRTGLGVACVEAGWWGEPLTGLVSKLD